MHTSTKENNFSYDDMVSKPAYGAFTIVAREDIVRCKK